MTNERLFRAIGEVGDDLIARAAYPKKNNLTWLSFAALAACAALVISLANISGMLDFGAKSAAPESQFAYADTTAEAPMESAPMMEEAAPEEAVTEEAAPEEPGAALPVLIVFDGMTYRLAPTNDGAHAADEMGSGELRGELLGIVEDGHPDYIGCEVYAYMADDCVLVLHDGEYELFRLE